MLFHADAMPEAAMVDADVCVVGGGPVGLQLARRLVTRGLRVTLAESGEEQPNGRIQDLNSGTVSGRWTGGLRDIRMRQFGGTIHVWGGNCWPLDPLDFEPRSWVPDSGWPVTAATIAPFMTEAHDALLLDSYAYRPEVPALPLVPEEPDFEEILFKLSRMVPGTREPFLGEYAQYLAAELRAAPALNIILGANVCEILLTPDRRSVEGVFAMTLQGRALHLRARAYVFACGGIETARLLLASREDMACGIGNSGDSVGRYFMEHPHGLGALLLAHPDRYQALRRFSPGQRLRTSISQHRLHLTDASQRRRELLNLSLQLIDVSMKPNEQASYEERFQALEATVPEAGWRRFYVVFLGEQSPNRVSLGPGADFFGIPQADLHWAVNEIDHRTVWTALELLRTNLFGGAEFRMLPVVAPTVQKWHIGHGAHHIGTTRMSATSRTGVVDRNCRIHGLSNGFCAGSSVFSTAGMANPMLTSIALAFRLSEHLVREMPSLPEPRLTGRMRYPAAYALAAYEPALAY